MMIWSFEERYHFSVVDWCLLNAIWSIWRVICLWLCHILFCSTLGYLYFKPLHSFFSPRVSKHTSPLSPYFFFFLNLFLYAGDYCMYTSLYKNIVTVTNFLHPHLCVIKKSLCSPGISTPNSYTSFLAPLLNRVL